MTDRLRPQLEAGVRNGGDGVPPVVAGGPGVMLTLRRHRRLPLAPRSSRHVFVVVSGVVMVEARPPDRRRLVLEILYPRDIFHAQDTPGSLDVALVAVSEASMQRFHPEIIRTLERDDPMFAHRLEAATALRNARRALRLVSLSGQSCEERLADFLVELGLFLGKATQAGRIFDLPLTREETADYLALNPDTLSRLFSRIKSAGLISISRGRATVHDWQALKDESPLAGALTDLWHNVAAET